MRLGIVLAALLMATSVQAEQTYEFTDFTSVEVREGVTARVIAGQTFSVTARAIEGDLSKLNVNQYGQWVVFSRDARWGIFPNWRRDKFEVIVTLPVLAEVKAFDHAAVTATGVVSETLRAEAGGNGDLILEGDDFGVLKLVVNDAGTLAASGTCDTLVVEGNGGAIAAPELVCEAAEIDAGDAVTVALSAATRIVDLVEEE